MRELRATNDEIAAALSVTPNYVSDLRWGIYWPSRALARKVYVLTDGKVTPTDFLSEEDLKKARRSWPEPAVEKARKAQAARRKALG